MFKFIHFIREEQDINEKRLLMMEAGQQTISTSARWKKVREARQKLEREYLEKKRSLRNFLDAIKNYTYKEIKKWK